MNRAGCFGSGASVCFFKDRLPLPILAKKEQSQHMDVETPSCLTGPDGCPEMRCLSLVRRSLCAVSGSMVRFVLHCNTPGNALSDTRDGWNNTSAQPEAREPSNNMSGRDLTFVPGLDHCNAHHTTQEENKHQACSSRNVSHIFISSYFQICVSFHLRVCKKQLKKDNNL